MTDDKITLDRKILRALSSDTRIPKSAEERERDDSSIQK